MAMYPMMYRKRGPGRLIWPVVWLLLIIYVISNPTEAAANTRELIVWLQGSAEAIVSFFDQIGDGR
jgi:hypothetical protein